MFIRKPLFYMAEGDGAGDGAGEAGAGDGGAGSGGGSGDAGGDQGGKPADEGKTFTQADIDRIIAGRLAKFADYEQIKSELSEVKASQMTEQEKAVETAKAEARADAIRETAPRLVAAEFRAALAGRRTAEQVAELIEDLDLSKYLTDAGEVDAERVARKADILAPASEERAHPLDLGQRKQAATDRATSLGDAIAKKIATSSSR